MFRILTLVVCLLPPLMAEVRQLTILHSNDLHARLLPDAYGRGGFAQLATVLTRERSACGHCLFLVAGDLVQGTAVSTVFKGTPVFEIANKLKIDAFALGNHEFDYGWQQIKSFRRAANFPVISANVADAGGDPVVPHPYVVLRVNGLRVGIIGLVMSDLVSGYLTSKTAGPYKSQPVVGAVQSRIRELRGKADVILVLGHIHQAEGSEIIRKVPEVAFVVEGHNHRGRVNPDEFEGRVAMGMPGYGVELGRMDLEFDTASKKVTSWKWKRIAVNTTVPADKNVAKTIDQWEKRVAKVVDVPIGEAKRDFEPSDLKPIIEQAMREEMKADFTFVNRGGIRDRLPKGIIKARNLWNIQPFDNMMVIARVPGSRVPAPLRGEVPVDADKTYVIALPDFLVDNEAQRTLLGIGGLPFERTNVEMRQLLIDWVKKKKILE